jgi:uncharacterized membrane protein YhhN
MDDLIIISIVISAVITIFTYDLNRKLFYLFKPLTTLLIIALCFSERFEIITPYQTYIAWGLMLSLAGDILLMLPERFFIHGIAAFLGAHILYVIASVEVSGWQLHLYLLIPILIYMSLLLWKLLPKTGKLFYPVIAYIAVVFMLLWQASGRVIVDDSASAIIALAGIILFALSDSILAIDKFVHRLPMAQAMILSTYYFGQTLIALSIPAIKLH